MPQVLLRTACVAYDIQMITGVVHNRIILNATLLVGHKRLQNATRPGSFEYDAGERASEDIYFDKSNKISYDRSGVKL